jgi:hypothetical protein
MREFRHQIYWYVASNYQKLTKDFLLEFKHLVQRDVKDVKCRIPLHRNLSENFIRVFSEELN